MPLIPVQAICILLSRLGLGINFIQWIPLRSYMMTHNLLQSYYLS